MKPNDMDKKPTRRTLLRRGAAVGAGLLIGSSSMGTATADREDDSGGHVVPGNYPPDENVEYTRVHPCCVPKNEDVPTGDWIQHAFGWFDLDNSKDDLLEFLDIVDTTVWIGGEPVEDAEQYYIGPLKGPKGRWLVVWAYTTPPKPPRVYDFEVELRWTEATADGSFEKGDTRQFGLPYRVVARD